MLGSKPTRTTLMKHDVMLAIQQVLPHSLQSYSEDFIKTVLGRDGDATKKVKSKTKKAGLHISIGRVTVYVRRFIPENQIRRDCFVIMASFLEYLLVEMFEVVKSYLEEYTETCYVTEEVLKIAQSRDRDLSKIFIY